MLLSKATYIAFKLQFYILSALAFPGNRTHDLGVASAMLYYLSYSKACSLNVLLLKAGPSLVGWKVVTIIGAQGWAGAPGDLNRLAKAKKKTIRTVAARRHESLSFTVFLSLANLNIQKSLKHSKTSTEKLNWVLARRVRCARREPRLTDSNTEPSSPSHPHASERTNSNRSLNMKTEKDVKEPN